MFLKTLGEACVSSGWKAHSFVLMGNHYHLLIETTRATLVKGMQYLNSTYTARYNARHKTRGHLFQGRYKALVVDGQASGYFLTVSDYIHLNPARGERDGRPSGIERAPGRPVVECGVVGRQSKGEAGMVAVGAGVRRTRAAELAFALTAGIPRTSGAV